VKRPLATVLMACWASLPVGAIYSIWTGDLRWLGIGLVLFVAAFALGYIVIEAAKQAAAKQAAAEQKIKDEARKFLDNLAAGRFHQ
jgi:type VI protein secretion system component VasK